jgi:pyruvate dehydrogenase E2 component (dihydrolipoamide acetyltransferase)
MATLLRMPEIAAGATEAVINEWLVAEDGAVEAGQPLVVIETEKATVEVEAESAARVLTLLAAAGATVAVGAPIAVLAAPGERVGDLGALVSSLGVGSDSVGSDSVGSDSVGSDSVGSDSVGSGGVSSLGVGSDGVGSDGVGSGGVGSDGVGSAQPARAGTSARVFASPLARRLLDQAGLDLTDADGTGPNGRITRRDVERAVAARMSAPRPAPAPVPASAAPARVPGAGTEVTRIPHPPSRRAVARRLTESKRTVPHFYLKGVCGVDALLALRAELNAAATERISINDLLVKAVGRAHTLVPGMNVAWSDDALLSFGQVDVGVAVAGGRGLVTPVVRAVDARSVSAVSADVRRFSEQAGNGRLRQSDLEGGSITVTNLGMYGVEEFAAIINPPQAAILAVGAGRPAPVVADGRLTTRTELTSVLSVDHRCVDGALAAHWMQAFRDCIEQPLGLLL